VESVMGSKNVFFYRDNFLWHQSRRILSYFDVNCPFTYLSILSIDYNYKEISSKK
jgi:hypothetical protein